jgi:antitoxin (DNA-binding transcriptional repressor) of toxin-antitoxin stability system
VAGRPVAQIVPLQRNTWVPAAQLRDLLKLPDDPTLATDLKGFKAGLSDPWSG